MTGRTLLASLLTTTALAALPGAAGAWVPPPVRAPACHRSAAPHPRVVATRTSTSTGRAAIVACDRSSGHRRTLRHGWVGDAPHRFPLLSTAAAQGTKVSWSELDGPVTHLRQDLRTADVRHAARRQARRQIGPAAGTTSKVAIDSDPLQVLALPGDALAYVVYGGPRDAVASALAVYRPGRPLRVVTKTIDRPARVDDGRTLVWLDRTGYHSLDTASVPRDATGCPVRRAFRDVALDTPDVRVTAASDTGFILDQELAVRVCWKATGRDAIALTLPEETTLSTPIVATGPFVAVTEQGIDRYQSCYSSSLPSTGIYEIWVVDARTGRVVGGGLHANCTTLRALVVDPAGVAAWLITDERGDRVETAAAKLGGSSTVLDSGPAGSLADLAASPGGGFTWAHDGAPRASASPMP
jgi:hypothetical protein